VKESSGVKSPHFELRAATALALFGLFSLSLPLGCKDEDPCDPGQELIGTGCFPIPSGGSSGTTSTPAAGAPGEGGVSDSSAAGASAAGAGSGIQPPGNPDAMFGTACQTNADCGGPAPICATDPLFYCSQINCQDGEENAGACPADWVCFKYLDNPSACVNPSSF